jgi:hypothetical protein
VTDRLPDELRALGSSLDMPAPSPDSVAEQVLARLLREPTPRPTRGVRIRAWLRARRRALVAVLAGLFLVLAVTPPVRAAVADWLDFGFGGVLVHHDPSATPGAGSPPAVHGSAPGIAPGIAPLVPSVLGTPDGVAEGEDGMVSMSWRTDGGGTVRLDQFPATLDPLFVKTSAEAAEYVEVDDHLALWFAKPHFLALVDEGGNVRRHEAARAAGPTLVWQDGGLTLRLEGVASKSRAIEIAESTESTESTNSMESTG